MREVTLTRDWRNWLLFGCFVLVLPVLFLIVNSGDGPKYEDPLWSDNDDVCMYEAVSGLKVPDRIPACDVDQYNEDHATVQYNPYGQIERSNRDYSR